MAALGQQLTLSVKFLDATGADVDPTTVTMWLREEIDGTELQWVFTPPATVVTTPAGQNAVVRDSAGDFHVNFVTRKPERLSIVWTGSGTVTPFTVQPQAQTVFVNHSPIVALDHP